MKQLHLLAWFAVGVLLPLLPLAAQVAPAPTKPTTPEAPIAATRVLRLRVHWKGELPPAPKRVRLDPAWAARNPDEAKLCGRCAEEGRLVDESLLVDSKTRGIANVAVSLNGLEGSVSALVEPLLDNAECRFTPRVQFAAAGSALRVRNSDPFAHTARLSDSAGHLLWNALIANAAESKTCILPRAGLHTVLCDMHPWMRASVIAVKHPFVGVSDSAGAAVVKGIPRSATKHVLVAWHESLGTARRTVDFAAIDGSVDAAGDAQITLAQQDFQRR